jgi:hypothetical protein
MTAVDGVRCPERPPLVQETPAVADVRCPVQEITAVAAIRWAVLPPVMQEIRMKRAQVHGAHDNARAMSCTTGMVGSAR